MIRVAAIAVALCGCHRRSPPIDAADASPARFPQLSGTWRAEADVPGMGRVHAHVIVGGDGDVLAAITAQGAPPITRLARIEAFDGASVRVSSQGEEATVPVRLGGDGLDATLPVVGDVHAVRIAAP